MNATVAADGSGALVFKVGDKVVSDTLAYTGTSWTSFEQVSGSITLDKGEQILTMEVAKGYIDIDYFEIQKEGTIAIAKFKAPAAAENYRIFDVNGVYVGMVRASGMQELRSNAKSLVKIGGAYIAKPSAGKILRIQVAK